MLSVHGIVPPLHMKEFGQHGECAGISECCRRELFLEVRDLVRSHSICTIAATLSNSEYEGMIQPEARDSYSVYAMCYIMALMMNHKLASDRYAGEIPIIFDKGNPNSNFIREAHAAALELQKSGTFLHAGALCFDDDAEFGSLQAADVIAWGVRRELSNAPFPPGMEPIKDLLAPEAGHNKNAWKSELLAMLRDGLARRVALQTHKPNLGAPF